MQNVSLKIAGMSCGHCVMAVKGALNEVEGITVHDVQVGAARIEIAAPATVEAACAAIQEAGYEVVEVK
jgi:copper chaperone